MSKRLLLADNSLAVQKLVEFSLGKEGYEITSVNDGLSALDLAERVEPDVILSDLNLKGVNVYNFCEKVRRKDKLKKTPILVLVNYTDSFDEEKLRSAGVVDFIRKPLESNELIDKVRNVGEIPAPVTEQSSLENLARRAPLPEREPPSEDSVKIEELLGWSVTEKSPFSEISDKVEPSSPPPPPDDEEIFVVEEPVGSPPQTASEAGDRGSEVSAETFPHEEPAASEISAAWSADDPPIDLASAAEMIPPVTSDAFDIPPMEIDDGPEPAVELVSAAEMTPAFSETPEEETSAAASGQEDQVRAMTEKMIQDIVSKIAKEVIEKVTWEVVPSLAEIAIRKELEKLNVTE